MSNIALSQYSFRQILVATDLSDASANALNYAKALAKRYASRIVLAHIVGPDTRTLDRSWTGDHQAQRVEERMESFGMALRSEGFSAVAACAYGPVEDELLGLVRTHNVDLVILGTHARQGFQRLLFGSKAEAVIRQSDSPVLTVGPAAVWSPKGAWLPRKILCATSLDVRSVNAAIYGYRLARDNGAIFTLFHIEERGHPQSPDTWRAFEKALGKELAHEARRPQIRGLFSSAPPAKTIVAAANERQADLIVLGARHAMFGSTHFCPGVVPQVAFAASCPVLTVQSH